MDARHEVSTDRLASLLADALAGLPPSDLRDVLANLPDALTPVPTPERPAEDRRLDRDLIRSQDWYAVHDSDIELLKEVVSAVLAVAGGKSYAAVGSLIVLLFKYRKKRVKLNEEQGLVLRELVRAGNGGLAIDQLVRKPDVLNLGRSRIDAALEQLKSIPRSDQTTTTLAVFQGDRWYAVDV